MDYYLMYKRIDKRTIMAVRKTIKSGVFKKENSDEYRIDLLRKLSKELCTIYNLDEVKINYCPDDVGLSVGKGSYNLLTKEIFLSNLSLVTFLHEFYHYYLDVNHKDNTEDKARGWSLSVYYNATPKLYKNAVQKGLILFQNPTTE